MDSFLGHARRRPDAVLFDLPGGTTLDYGATADIVHRIAARLRADGVEPGDRVAMQVDKSPEAIALYLATLQVGGVFLPLNTAYTGPEVDYFLGDATPRVLVCTPAREAEFRDRVPASTMIETLGTEGDGSLLRSRENHHDVHPADPGSPAAILYTSGTTGRSKGAVLTHGNLASNCDALREYWRYTAEDRLIHALPIFHIHGLFVAANLTLTTGASMHYLPKFDADAIVDLIPRSTVLMGVPTFYTRLAADSRVTPELCAGMRLFVSGSAPLLASDHAAFGERSGHRILERYGMTETGMNTSNPYEGERRPGTVGLPLPGVEVRITDRETGASLARGEIGGIEVRGPNVFAGYWNMPEKTAAEFCEDGFFRTGDVGRFDDDGYLSIVGRDKDMVISGGFNVYPVEIEELLDAQPAVAESAVIGVPHPDLGETVVAVVVAAPGQTPDESALIGAVADRLARFKQPKAVRVVEALPRNVMGKVQKAELRTRYAGLFTDDGA
nr:AMP-binding protein [Dietzia sp. DQ11-38-2]